MKLKTAIIAGAVAALAAMSPSVATAQVNLGVGPAIAGSATQSQLPADAQKFLQKHYKHTSIRNVEREFDTGTYEVDLADGTDIEFNSAGRVINIESSDRGPALSKDVVKDLLPAKAYKRLEADGIVSNIDEIELHRGGNYYEIKTRAVRKMKYGYDVTEDTWVLY